MLITDVAEALSKELDGQVIVVGAGQAALTGVKLLNKLMDRFTLRIQLSDTDMTEAKSSLNCSPSSACLRKERCPYLNHGTIPALRSSSVP